MLLSFKLPSFCCWRQELGWCTVCGDTSSPAGINTGHLGLWEEMQLHVAQSWGMLISPPLYFGVSFWTLLRRIVFVLSFSLLFFIWLNCVSAFYCINLAKWIQGVSDSTFVWADGKTRQFQIVILAHYSSLMYTAFEFNAPEVCCIIKYWWKVVKIDGLKYWVNYMVGVPVVEWFALCHAGSCSSTV